MQLCCIYKYNTYFCNIIALTNFMKSKNYDLVGMSAAFLCMIHCVAFPLLIFIPIGVSHNHYIDSIFLLIGIWSVYKTTKNSSSSLLKFTLWASVLFISCSVAVHILYHSHSPLMYVGATGLIIGHLINFKSHTHN